MKRVFGAMSVLTLAVLLLCALFSQAAADPIATITLLNPPPNQLLELEVGESYTFDILVESDEPFILAMAMPDAYYPGRGVSWHSGDRAHNTTSAILHLTMTGKKPTAEMATVCDWPLPGDCWPEGVVPASIVAGVRYKKGIVISEQFPFAVVVP